MGTAIELTSRPEPELIVTGAYGLCRNPVYVGTTLSYLGLLVLVPSALPAICLPLYAMGNHVHVLYEERFLCIRFESRYTEYCRSVGRYGLRRWVQSAVWIAGLDREWAPVREFQLQEACAILC
jgi:protein-S-isoprenylcysteine O-methyltransferase Ste14